MPAPSRTTKLGTVASESGIVVIIDMGLLDLWSGLDEPVMSDRYGEEIQAKANAARDYRVEGDDAAKAGVLFDRQWHPAYLYDVPELGAESLSSEFAELVSREDLDARLVQLPRRVPHEERLAHALQRGGDAGVVQYHGCSAVVVDVGVRQLRADLLADSSQDGFGWDRVRLCVHSDRPMIRRKLVGHVAVDEARLCMASPSLLRKWEHDDPIDGLADLVFWGRDAAAIAERFEVPATADGQYGWCDLPVEEAVRRGMAIESFIRDDANGVKAALDFRPHSHHFQVLQQIWTSTAEAGLLDIDDEALVGFMTQCGDGFFPVFVEYDHEDQITAIVVEFAVADGD